MKGRLDIIQLLEKAGANLDLSNKDGRTALHLAIQHGNKKGKGREEVMGIKEAMQSYFPLTPIFWHCDV